MLVFCRRELAPPTFPTHCRALLLEGSWNDDESTLGLSSLDDEIDARRFGWIDEAAEQLAAQVVAAAAGEQPDAPNFADLNVVRLRYAAVKWLRPLVWLRALPRSRRPPIVELFADPTRDAEHLAVWQALAAADDFLLTIREHIGRAVHDNRQPPRNALWRRTLARLLANRRLHCDNAGAPRVLLCGNPRLLDPVCDELLRRGAKAAWLYDRFPVGAWRQRRNSGVRLLTCDTKRNFSDRYGERLLRRPVDWGGIDLSPVVEAWYRAWRSQLGANQSRQWRAVGGHIQAFRPTHVVVDEDATPLARMVVEQAARVGARSLVVQHGVCGVRFGFAPLKADAICAADEGSRRQLRLWGVPEEQITVTGSPAREAAVASLSSQGRQSLGGRRAGSTVSQGLATLATRNLNIVFLATVPPRDDRPDAVAFHLTTRSYETMLRGALTTLAERPNITLSVKPHPRAPHEPILKSLLADTPGLCYRMVDTFPTDAALVVSCGSGAGIDAAAAGLPVIQLLPEGSGKMLTADWYGLCGTARSATEFAELLDEVLNTVTNGRQDANRLARPEPRAMGVVNSRQAATPFVGDSGTCRAAARIADLIYVANSRRAAHGSPSRAVEECGV